MAVGSSLVEDTLVAPDDGPIPGDEFLHGGGRFDPDGPTCDVIAPFPGERIGRYLLGKKLAQGTFGLVFSARDLELDRTVALKILDPDHLNKREIVQRFLQEATAAGRIGHPGVVTILDCGQDAGGAYIAMDLLDGESLTARLESCGRFLPNDAIEIARQIAAALEAAHAAGVLHRDLKPDNIFIVNDPSMLDGLRVKILDFGLAKLELESASRARTRVRSVFGTPRYMSPEQCRSTACVDHRTDIYALGCILFEMITGAPPFDGDMQEIVLGHTTRPIPRASAFAACSPHLDELIAQLLAKDPARRPASMTAVRRALDRVPLGRLGSSPAILPALRTPLPAPASVAWNVRGPAAIAAPRPALPPPLPSRASRRRARGTSTPPPIPARVDEDAPTLGESKRLRRTSDAGAPRVTEPPCATNLVALSFPNVFPSYFPRPPVASRPVVPPTPLPIVPPQSIRAQLALAVAVPVMLPRPSVVVPAPVSAGMLPLILIAIACSGLGVLAGLLLT